MIRRRIEWVLALVLILAAILKAYQQLFAPPPAIGFHLNPLQIFLLIQAELLLSAWLFAGGFSFARFVSATVCFALFAAVAWTEALHGKASCGCFGSLKVPPAITGSFDLAAVVALWITRPKLGKPRSPRTNPTRVICSATTNIILSIAMWTTYFVRPAAATAGDLVVLEPTTWVGKQFVLFDEIEGSEQLHHGRWLILLYHYDCEDCRQTIPLYQALAARAHIAFIAMPPLAPAGQDPVQNSSEYLHLSLRQDHDWFATTPVVATMEGGLVITSADGANALQPPNIK